MHCSGGYIGVCSPDEAIRARLGVVTYNLRANLGLGGIHKVSPRHKKMHVSYSPLYSCYLAVSFFKKKPRSLQVLRYAGLDVWWAIWAGSTTELWDVFALVVELFAVVRYSRLLPSTPDVKKTKETLFVDPKLKKICPHHYFILLKYLDFFFSFVFHMC